MMLAKYQFSVRIMMIMSMLFAAFISQSAQAVCNECGTVTDVKVIKTEGNGGGIGGSGIGVGTVAGGVLGGVLGHQIGGGTGRDLATIGGVVGGAYVGHQVEKKSKSATEYHVIVEMEDGSIQTFKYASKTSYEVGDKVKVMNGKLVRP